MTMKRLLLVGFLFPITTFAQVSYSVTVTRLKAKADDCDGGIVTLCGNAPQDPVYNIWSTDAEANLNTYCWIFEDDPQAEYNLWKDIQNVELANETNVLTNYISFDMAGFESDNLNPGCTSSFGDDAIHDQQFVQQIDLSTLTEGGTENTMTLNLNDVYYAEIVIIWYDLTASVLPLNDVSVKIAPNPNNGNFKVLSHGITGERTIEVRDMYGRVISSISALEDESMIQLDGVAAGTYFIAVRFDQGEVMEKISVF
mgnify:CR=1 FL=1